MLGKSLDKNRISINVINDVRDPHSRDGLENSLNNRKTRDLLQM